MSKEIDERVVELRFDNQQFESNVKTTMSTLDKLKEKLHFKGAEKGLDGVSKAAKKVDLSPISKSAETVGLKFNAMYTIADQALRNITNSAMHAGKKIASALTIDPIKTGFQEYETQINAVQTILANTQSKGTTLDQVNAALDTLNTYADKTIYNFTEMTRNIGTFTAAGVDLETSVNAIQGIANLAAVSGSTSQQASTAMYQLSQALASGTVKLMDWNSVVNAGMGGQVFQDALKETARTHGIAIDKMIENEGSFRETLKEEWLTAEILTETLQKFTLTTEGLTEAEIKQNREMLRNKGYTEDQIDAIFELGKTATDAATKVKTFSQMWDVMKESAQSGWAQTWRLLVGDFEAAKELFTPLANFFTNAIGKMSDARNKLIEGALGSPLGQLAKKISKVTNVTADAAEKMKNYGDIVNKVLKGDLGNGQKRWDKLTEAGYDWAHVQNLVNKKLGSSKRYATDYKEAQEDLTEQTIELTDAKLKEIGLTDEEIKAYRDLEKQAKESGVSVNKLIENMNQMDGRTMIIESFKNVGQSLVKIINAIKTAWTNVFTPMTSMQLYNIIEGLYNFSKKLKMSDETADKLRVTMEGLFSVLDIVFTLVGGPIQVGLKLFVKLLSSADIKILDFTASIGEGLIQFRAWIDSWLDFEKICEPIIDLVDGFIDTIREWFDEFKKSEEVQNLIDKFKSFAEAIKLDGSAADNFEKITNGLVTLSTKLSYVLNASLLSGLKVFGAILNLFGTNLMDVAAAVVDYLGKAKKWVNENILIANTIDEVAKILVAVIEGIQSCAKAFMALEPVQKFIENFKNSFVKAFSAITSSFSGLGITGFCDSIKNAFAALTNWIQGLNNSDNIGRDIMLGLLNGLKAGASSVISFMVDIGTRLINAIKGILGINSPSTVMIAIGGFLISGLIIGIKSQENGLLNTLKSMFSAVVEYIRDFNLSSINWDMILGLGVIAGIAVTAKKILGIMEMFGKGVQGFGSMCSGAGKLMTAFANKIDPQQSKFESISEFMLKLAISIGILAASMYVLSKIPVTDLLKAGVALVALGAAIIILSKSAVKASANGAELGKISLMLLGISASMLIMATAMKKLDFLDSGNIVYVLGGLAGMIAGLAGILFVLGTFVKGKTAMNIDKAGITIMKMSIVMLSLATVIKIISKLDPAALLKGGVAIVAFGGIITGLIAATKLAGKRIALVGKTILQISAAMILLTIAIKAISKLDPGEIAKGIVCIALFGGVVTGLVAATKLATTNDLAKVSGTLMGMGIAMFAMALTAKILGSMRVDAFAKGIVGVALLGGVITGLVAATCLVKGTDLAKVGTTLMSMSIAIGILAAVSVVLSLISLPGLLKGVGAVAVLATLMAGLTKATQYAQDCKGTIYAMVVAIGVMAASVAALSFIDGSKLAGATIALATLMGMFAYIMQSSAFITGSIAPLIAMTVAVGLLAVVVGALANFTDPASAIAAAVSLSVLIMALSVSMQLLTTAGANIGNAALGALALLTMAVPLAAFVGVLAMMQNIQNAANNALILTGLATVMTLLLIPLTLIGAAGMAGLPYLGVLALLTMAVPLAAFVGVLAMMQGIKNAETNANALTSMVTAISDALFKVSILGPLSIAGLAAITSMIKVIGVMGVLLTAIGAIMDKCPNLEQFLDKGIGLLEKIATALGNVLGNIVDGFLTSATKSLPDIGKNISDFMTSLSLDGDTAKGVERFVDCFKSLALALAGTSIASMFDIGNNNITNFGKQLESFADSTVDVKPSKVKAAAKAAKELAETASEIPFDVGHNNLTLFGAQIAAFAPNLKSFADSTIDIKPSKVKAAAKAAKELAETASEIPFDWNHNNLTLFGAQLEPFGKAIGEFGASVASIQPDKIKAAAKAGKEIAKAASEIPFDFNHNNLTLFGDQLEPFGNALSKFGTSVATIQPDKIKAAAKVGKDIAKTASEIPSDWGHNNLKLFGDQLEPFGEALSKFSYATYNIEPDKIKAAAKAGKDLAKAASTVSESDIKGDALSKISDKLDDFGSAIGNFASGLEGVDTSAIESSGGVVEKMASVIETIVGLTTDAEGNAKDIDFTVIDTVSGKLQAFGQGVADFSYAITGIDAEKSKAAATVGGEIVKAISAMTTDIGESGTDIDLEGFAEKVKTFGTSIKEFATAINIEDVPLDSEKAKLAAQAGVEIIKAIQSLSSETSGVDLSELNVEGLDTKFSTLGSAIGGFAASFGENFNADTVISAAESGKKVIGSVFEVSKQIDDNGVDNLSNLENFKSWATSLGEGISAFGTSLGQIDTSTVDAAVKSGQEIIKMAKSITAETGEALSSGGGDTNAFVSRMTSLGQGISSFASAVGTVSVDLIQSATNAISSISGINIPDSGSIDGATSSIKSLIEMINSLAGLSPAVIESFKTNLTNLGTEGIDAFIKAFTDSNTTVSSAINAFVSYAATCVSTHKNPGSAFYTNAVSLGKYLVEGFASGIKNNQSLVDQAVTAMTDAATALANANLKVNSPSKVFMKTGGSVVEGFAKGITDNVGDATKAAVNMGNAVLKATQKELQINSPSLVFDKKVGRYIVQGIADGITKDMSAEEAAEKKAQNIVSAFQKEFDRLSIDSEIAKVDFDIWSSTIGKYATPEVVDAKELAYYEAELKRATDKKALAYNQWTETNEYLKKKQVNAQAEREAWKAYRDAELETAEINNTIADIKARAMEREYENLETAKELRDTEYELWKTSNDKSATDIQKDQRYISYLNDNLKYLNDKVQLNVKEYNDAIKNYGKESEQALAALKKCYQTDIEIAETQEAIARVSIDAAERQQSVFDEAIDARNKEHDIWENENKYASADEKDAANLKRLKSNVNDLKRNLIIAKANYQRVVELYGSASDEAKEAAAAIRDIRDGIAGYNSEIADIYDEAEQRELDLLETRSSNADLEYQLWEKTTGRKASGVERNVMKISTLSKQLNLQSELLEEAYDSWYDARKKYGEYSTEAQDEYTKYLNKQLDIANIQNELVDLEERAETKQKNALRDYEDYVKKYKKYYLQNGMTEADLIKDAKLVSGYNPDDTVNNIVERTKAALNSIQNNDKYSDLINSFSSMGKSYVDAVYDGISSEAVGMNSAVTSAINTMIDNCTKTINKHRTAWETAGMNLVQGFVDGIRKNSMLAASAVETMVNGTVVTGIDILEIHSPSRVFANMGRYAVMGLAKGLIENTKLSNNAASDVANSAIESLKNTISKISETVDSDMDTQPTIRPVLDLTNVKAGVAKLNTMISASKAMGISASMSDNSNKERQNGTNNANASNTYNYTQNNYSPKALSRTEIYRQTKTLLATKRGVHA